ncbi:hypothetical protein [Myceligenerans pegani]|uniref:Uncharacterized protein n=1 Tax=Myceligenerans pegani TaxID=2776917 RepID=A0ABR9N4D5_9MICO|nr:hypothetical protein [Myceligenerans sp. TRM 65318]MBE1878535.1 hypothetical protein [Myceligenerans sp. TRM 65318]MBE3020806.1 hypothetical protein [Myceligenerans sp. TRM 65318]
MNRLDRRRLSRFNPVCFLHFRPTSEARQWTGATNLLGAPGQLSLWWSLPRDRLGHILDENILVQNLTDGLRLAGGLKILTGENFAIAAGLNESRLLSRGTYTGVDRSSMSVKMNPKPVQVVLDEAVTSAAFDHGAPEVARPVTSMLLSDFDKQR